MFVNYVKRIRSQAEDDVKKRQLQKLTTDLRRSCRTALQEEQIDHPKLRNPTPCGGGLQILEDGGRDAEFEARITVKYEEWKKHLQAR